MATVQVLTKNRMFLNNLSLLMQSYIFHVNHERFVYNFVSVISVVSKKHGFVHSNETKEKNLANKF